VHTRHLDFTAEEWGKHCLIVPWASEATCSPSGGVIRNFRDAEQLLVLVVGKIKRIKKQIDTTYNNYSHWGRTAWPKKDFATIRVRSQTLLAAARGESNSTTVTDAGRIFLLVGQFLPSSAMDQGSCAVRRETRRAKEVKVLQEIRSNARLE